MHGDSCTCDHETSFMVPGAKWIVDGIRGIDVQNANERNRDMFKRLIRVHGERFDNSVHITPDVDLEENHVLILHIEFRSPCDVVGIHLLSDEWPDTMKLWTNRSCISYENYRSIKVDHEVSVIPDGCAQVPHTVKIAQFKGLTSLQLAFLKNTGNSFDLKYVGIKGVESKIERRAVTTVYEARPNLADHEVKNRSLGLHSDCY